MIMIPCCDQHNVGYASTCNSVGQTAGYFMGYVLFMALESYGLVTLPGKDSTAIRVAELYHFDAARKRSDSGIESYILARTYSTNFQQQKNNS
jgi:Acetyl-coenzyme A transporter 1